MQKKTFIVLGGVLLAGVILVLSLVFFNGGNIEVPTGHYVPAANKWWDNIYFADGQMTYGMDSGVSYSTTTYDYKLNKKGELFLENGVTLHQSGITSEPPEKSTTWVIKIIDDNTFEIGTKGGIKFKYVRYQN